MRVSIQQKEFKDCMSGLFRIVPRNFPAFQGIKFFARNGGLHALSTNVSETAIYEFDAAEVERSGEFIVSSNDLRPLTKGKQAERIVLEEAANAIAVTSNVAGREIVEHCGKTELTDFPKIAPAVDTKPVDTAFLDVFRKAAQFVSKDDQREILKSVNLCGSENCMVATDGRRLSCFNSVEFPWKTDCNITPSRFLMTLKNGDECEAGVKTINETMWFALRTGRWLYVARCVDGVFPNWKQVIPAEAEQMVNFSDGDVDMLSNVLPRFAGHDSDPQGVITLVGKDGRITVHGKKNGDEAWSALELKDSVFNGKDGVISVNRWYLLDAFNAGFKRFAFADSHSPLLSHDTDGGVHVLMPMTLEAPDGVEAPQAQDEEAPAETEKTAGDERRSEQAPAATQRKPIRREGSMPKQKKQETTENPLDRILVAYEAVKVKLNESRTAMNDIAEAIKQAVRDQKTQRSELENARILLGKLQAVKI